MQSVQGKTAEFPEMLCDEDNNLSPRICCCSLKGLGALWEPSLSPLFSHKLRVQLQLFLCIMSISNSRTWVASSSISCITFFPRNISKGPFASFFCLIEALRHFSNQYVVWLVFKGSWEPQVKEVSKISIPSHLSPTFWYIYRINVIAESWVDKDHELLKQRLLCPYTCSDYSFCTSCS